MEVLCNWYCLSACQSAYLPRLYLKDHSKHNIVKKVIKLDIETKLFPRERGNTFLALLEGLFQNGSDDYYNFFNLSKSQYSWSPYKYFMSVEIRVPDIY